MKTITRKMLKIGRSNNGFTVLELIFSLIILIFSLMTVASVSQMITGFSSRINTKQKISQIKAEVITDLSQNKSWLNIVSNAGKPHPTQSGVSINSDLTCIKDRVACNVGTYGLTLINMNGQLITDPNTATKGFDLNGVICNKYGIDPNCAFRFDLTWSATCPQGQTQCTDPQVKVKINMLTSSASYSMMQAISASSFELLIDRPKSEPPVVKNASLTTNSKHYYPSEAPAILDPSSYIYSDGASSYTVNPPTGNLSANGSTVTVSNNIITYNPKNGFYGFDNFQYQVVDDVTGQQTFATAWVWVMTPYTWTGLGSDSKTSTNKNFCGKVVNGVCNGITFPATDKHYIFGKNCTKCDAELNTNPNTLEMMSYYPGTIKQTLGTVTVRNAGAVTWAKTPTFSQSSGTFDGQSNLLHVDMSNMPWGYVFSTTDTAFSLSGGVFKAPTTLRIVGPVKITNNSSFEHHNGLVNLFQLYGTNREVKAPGVHFYNLQFDSFSVNYGNHYGFMMTDSFIVDHNLIFDIRGLENAVSGGKNKIISVKGDVYANGNGGLFADPVVVSLDGDNDQTVQGVPTPAYAINPKVGWDKPDNVNNLIPFLPVVRVNKTSGKAIIKDWVGFTGFEVIKTSSSTGLDISNATFVFSLNGGVIPFIPGDFHYQNVYFVPGTGSSHSNMFINAPELNIDGNLYHYTIGYSHLYGLSGTSTKINLLGDLYIDGGFDHDYLSIATTVHMIGSNPSTIWGSTTSISQAHIVVNKSSGAAVTMKGGFGTTRDLTALTPLIVDSGVDVRIPSHGWNGLLSVFNTPNVQFHNIFIDHGFRANSAIQLDGSLNIATRNGGSYSVSLGGTGFFNLAGDLNIGGNLSYGGGLPINFIGSTDSNINFTASPVTAKNFGITDLIINKSGSNTVNFNNGGNLQVRNFALNGTNNTFNMLETGTLRTTNASSAVGTTINRNGSTLLATTSSYLGVVNP